MAISNKQEIKRVINASGKRVDTDFYGWYEKKCRRLLEVAIQGTGPGKLVRITETEMLLKAMGKGI